MNYRRRKKIAGYNYSPRETVSHKKAKAYRQIALIAIVSIAILTVGVIYLNEAIDRISNGWGFFNQNNDLETSTSASNNQDNLLWTPQIDPLPIITNQKKITVTGTAFHGKQVELFFNGQSIAIDDLDENNKFEFTDLNLQSGENIITALTIKENGNKSNLCPEVKISLDLIPPELEITNPEDGKKFGSTEQKIQVTGNSEVDAKVYVNDHIAILKSDNTFSYQITLTKGENVITIKAIDETGNETKQERKVTFDP